jgi:hypothetical protein
MANTLKTPIITADTKILSFDLEANGLHGEAFAVGAVVMSADGQIYDQFVGRTQIIGKTDEWVELNVLPAILDMEVTHSSYKHLRDNFWAWFLRAKDQSEYVLVNNGYPVEYRFLIQCQEDNLNERYWDHPFPVLDLTSFLVGRGDDVQEVKTEIMSNMKEQLSGMAHHPLYDAQVAAMCVFSSLGLTGK